MKKIWKKIEGLLLRRYLVVPDDGTDWASVLKYDDDNVIVVPRWKWWRVHIWILLGLWSFVMLLVLVDEVISLLV